jgi:hypothetical protein
MKPINRVSITGTTSRQLYEMSLRTAEDTSLPPLSHNVLVGALVSEAWSTGRYKALLKALAEARQSKGAVCI